MLRNFLTVPIWEVYSLVLPLVMQNEDKKFPIKNMMKFWRNSNGNN